MEKRFYPKFHIAPPSGWLNDPNGMSFFDGILRVFFQHAPNVSGGLKSWGHAFSSDFFHWSLGKDAVEPTLAAEKDGAYSGTALTADGSLEIFYTGNVKHAGDFDYINAGREHNVIRAFDFDGETFKKKEVVLTNADFPTNLSCHVRDPKVWKEGDIYRMILGARTRDSRAALLFMESDEKRRWRTTNLFVSESCGYMFECPDIFELGGKTVLSFCPQGIKEENFKFQNENSSIYIMLPTKMSEIQDYIKEHSDEIFNREKFIEWDSGFDFYAPQTCDLDDGRKVLIGWAGVPDSPYTNEPANAEGWQHSMTILREISISANGKMLQNPIREVAALHTKKIPISPDTLVPDGFDGEFILNGNGKVRFDNSLEIKAENGILSLDFLDDSGSGRKSRKAKIDAKKVRVLFDRSIIEVFANDGECVMTTRFYPKTDKIPLHTDSSGEIWAI